MQHLRGRVFLTLAGALGCLLLVATVPVVLNTVVASAAGPTISVGAAISDGTAGSLGAISCGSATSCDAAGSNSSGNGELALITNGAFGTVTSVPTVGSSSIACPTATQCYIAGATSTTLVNGTTGPAPAVVTVTNETPGAATAVDQPIENCIFSSSGETCSPVDQLVTGGFRGIACAPGSTNCVGIGAGGCDLTDASGTPTNSPTWVDVVDNGSPTPLGPANCLPIANASKNQSYSLNAVACTSAVCYAVGLDSANQEGVIFPVTNGVPESPVDVPGTFQLTGVACTAGSTCVAVGPSSSVQSSSPVAVNISGGSPQGGPVTYSSSSSSSGLSAVACTPATCVGVGTDHAGVAAEVFSAGSLSSASTLQSSSGAAFFGGVACPTAALCVAVGGNNSADGVLSLISLSDPEVTSVQPTNGPMTGGTDVDISGVNFVSNSTVAFCPIVSTTCVPAASTAFDSSGELHSVSPDMTSTLASLISSGTLPSGTSTLTTDIVVTDPGPPAESSGRNPVADGFIFQSLTVTNVSPPSGPGNGGQTITVTGSGFESNGSSDVASVRFCFNAAGSDDDVNCTPPGPSVPSTALSGSNIDVTGDSTLTVTTPNALADIMSAATSLVTDVQVTTSAGATSPINPSNDTYTFQSVTVTSVTPSSGPAAPTPPATANPQIKVIGTGFMPNGVSDVAGINFCWGTLTCTPSGDTPLTGADIDVLSDTQLLVTPPDATADILPTQGFLRTDVQVVTTSTPPATSAINPSDDSFTFDELAINSVNPPTASPLGTCFTHEDSSTDCATVTFTGTGFLATGSTLDVVTLCSTSAPSDCVNATNVTVLSNTVITADLPPFAVPNTSSGSASQTMNVFVRLLSATGTTLATSPQPTSSQFTYSVSLQSVFDDATPSPQVVTSPSVPDGWWLSPAGGEVLDFRGQGFGQYDNGGPEASPSGSDSVAFMEFCDASNTCYKPFNFAPIVRVTPNPSGVPMGSGGDTDLFQSTPAVVMGGQPSQSLTAVMTLQPQGGTPVATLRVPLTFGVRIDGLQATSGSTLLAPAGGDSLTGTVEGGGYTLAFCPQKTYSADTCSVVSALPHSPDAGSFTATAPAFNLHSANSGSAFVFALSPDFNGLGGDAGGLTQATAGDAPSSPITAAYGVQLRSITPTRGAPGTPVTLSGVGFGPTGTGLTVNFCPNTDDHPECVEASAPGGGPPTVASNGTLSVVAPTPPPGTSILSVYIDVPSSPGDIPLASTADQGGMPFTYVGAPPSCSALSDCQSSTNATAGGSAIATSTSPSGSITATASGLGSVTVGRYGTNPVGNPTFSAGGSYFDVVVGTPNNLGSVTISDCDLASGNAVEWWNPTGGSGMGAWQPVSSQTFSAGPPACVTATLNSGTSPSLSQLTGTVFAIAHDETIAVQISGPLTYSDTQVVTSGEFAVTHPAWPPMAITGKVSVPGAHGGSATMSLSLHRFLFLFFGSIGVDDTVAGVDTNAVVNPLSVTRYGSDGLTGTALGLVRTNRGLSAYVLKWTITWPPGG